MVVNPQSVGFELGDQVFGEARVPARIVRIDQRSDGKPRCLPVIRIC